LWLTLYHWPHIRTLYNWHVFYVPSSSLRSWWIRHHHKAAGRKQLQEMFPQKGKPKLTTHINWLSVFNPFNLPESFFFLVFRIVRRLNRLYYNRVPTEHRYNYIWYRDGTT